MINKILIANRGEIALRIIRACKEMGIQTVAIYSEADRESLPVQIAHEAICIGGPRPQDSYLNMGAIIQAACNAGCDAIHPGFGFLSENAQFARLVAQCGLIFIGPSPEVIEQMGNKSIARQMMVEADVPIIPGTKALIMDVDEGCKRAVDLGYPVMIKAANGGGGKGMRIITSADNFAEGYDQAKREALANFGDDSLYLEKYIEAPKHIEVQIMGDQHGNILHLYERDCSFQRRNQKMIEEAPCSSLSKPIREAIIADALKAARAVNYDSVGTIEFLVDKYGKHYFMEMNTRIQVEHPITEMITGIDIVKQQIRIADGRALDLEQDDIQVKGHAIECRINAENVKEDFKASPGKVSFINLPGGKDVRIESAVYPGYAIPPYYDSMILKLITYAPTRLECLKKMRVALEELIIDGVLTNIEFHYLVLHSKTFVEGKYHTGFFETFMKELVDNGEFI